MASQDELACTYAALMLADDGVAVTAEKIMAILKASKVEVEGYWPGLFAKALEGIDIKELVSNVGSGAGSAAPAAGAPAAGAPAAVEETKEVKKEESESDEDGDMGFGLFD